jgi:RNA polymerase sigma-70 factor (ECF subfamily)
LFVAILNPTFMEERTFEAPDLLDQARAGDVEAFSAVCRAYETRLLRQALSLCGEVNLAKDLAQDTLVEAWRSLRRYNGRCLFFTWLCAILLNRYRNTLRESRSRPSSLLEEERRECETRVNRLSDPNALPDETIELREQAMEVQRCIQMLPRKHQQVIYLRFYVDNSLESIAAALGCSVGTVKSRLFHALEKLRGMKALSRQCDRSKTVENV